MLEYAFAMFGGLPKYSRAKLRVTSEAVPCLNPNPVPNVAWLSVFPSYATVVGMTYVVTTIGTEHTILDVAVVPVGDVISAYTNQVPAVGNVHDAVRTPDPVAVPFAVETCVGLVDVLVLAWYTMAVAFGAPSTGVNASVMRVESAVYISEVGPLTLVMDVGKMYV